MIYVFIGIAVLAVGVALVLLYLIVRGDNQDNVLRGLAVINRNYQELYDLVSSSLTPVPQTQGNGHPEAVEASVPVVEQVEKPNPELPPATKPWGELSGKERMSFVRAGVKRADYEAMLREG